MPFDPSKPFEVVDQEAPAFDPGQPFELENQAPPFDPSKPWEPEDSLATQAGHLGGALVTGVKRALRDVDVIQRNREGADVPSPGDRARARAASLADPSRIRGRVGTAGPTVRGILDLSRAPEGASAAAPMNGPLSFAGGESQFGMPAKLEQATRQKSTERAATEFDIATQSADLATRPKSQTMQDWEKIGENDWWSLAKAVASNPVEIIGTISLESLPASLTGLAGGPAGVGASSFASEYAGTLVSEAGAQGYDFTKPEDVARFFNNPDAVRRANQVAQTRGATVGAIDAITAGLAGRFMGPAMGRGAGPVLRAVGAETGMQMAGGAGGEALASGLSGQPITVKNVLSEAVAELASAPGEVVSNLREDAGARAVTPVRAQAPVVHAAPDPDSDLVVPGQEPAPSAQPQPTAATGEEAAKQEPNAPGSPVTLTPAASDTWMEEANLSAQGVVPPNEPAEGETVDQFLSRFSQMQRVRERAASMGMGDVDVRWAPDLTDPQGRPVAGWVEPATGRVVLNAAAPVHQSDATSLPVLREEGAHALLASQPGRSAVRAFAISRLTEDDVTRLTAAGYTRQAGETETDYRDRLADEAIAKAAREQLPWWRELVERTRAWIAERSGGLIEVSNAEAARAILRSLKQGRGVPTRGAGVARMSLGDEDGINLGGRRFVSWKDLEPYLTESERATSNKAVRTRVAEIARILPPAEEFAAAAMAGAAKRGWYRRSAEALVSVFKADAPRFAALLAALSPQTSVEANFENALRTWANWIAAGRPTDREAILDIMGRSVIGNKGRDSVLGAWINNSVSALTSEAPEAIVLSGPKVSSFAANLRGVTNEVTNDTWMANFALIDQTLFKGSLNVKGTEPGKGSGYKAMNAVVRKAAAILTERTGEAWTAAEVQETVWSWAKALVELSEATGVEPSVIVERGGLTDEIIAGTPDFATLFAHEPYRTILEGAGLKPPEAGGGGGAVAGTGANSQATPWAAGIAGAAARLDNLRAYRDARARTKADLDQIQEQIAASYRPRVGKPQGAGPSKSLVERQAVLERKLAKLDSALQGVKSPSFKEQPRLSIEDEEQPRRFGEQVTAAPDVSPAVKGRLGNLLYTPRANEPDAAFASRIVDQVGPVPAMDVFRDRANGLPGAVRGMLAQVIVKRLAEAEHAAAAPADQTALADQAARFLDQDVFEATTEAGQFIQAFAAFSALTPRGMLAVYRRTIDRSVEGARRRLAGVLRQLFGELADLNTAAVQELGRDRAAQRATTAAVNDAVKAAPEVNEAVRVVVAGELGSNPRIQQGVREAVSRAFAAAAPRLRAQSLWSQYLKAAVARIATERRTSSGRVMLADFTRSVAGVLRAQVETQFPTGPRAERAAAPTALEQLSTLLSNPEKAREVWTATIQALREAHPNDPRVDALAQQPAALYSPQLLAAVVREEMDRAEFSLRDMVAGNYRAAGDGATLVQRIVAATGAEGEVAQRLARAVDDVWRESVFRERTNLDNRIRSVRERESRLARAARSGLVVTDQLADSEIDRAIAGALRAARTNLGAVLKQHFEARAQTTRTLAQAFVQDARLPEPVATQLASQLQGRMRELLRARRLDAITRAKKAMPIAQRGRLPVDKLVDLADLGLLTEQRAWDAVRDELKLPAFDPVVAREVTRRAEALRALPEGFQQDEAAIGLLDFIANQRGMSIGDLAMAFWYANTLSRPITHLVNGISNLVQVGAHTAFTAAREPGSIPATLEALADGFKAGADEGLAVLKTGKVPYYRSNKLEASQPLERLTGDAAWERVLSKWKYVARALAASDMVFYKASEGVRKDVLARAIARREGLKGDALVARTAEILGRTEGIRRAAEQRAEGEGLVGERRRRRVRELMDQVAPADLAQNAKTHALEVIFNSEPYGVLGAVARGLGSILRDVPALRLVVPFVRVVANVTNEALNYVPPIGAGRAIASRAFGADLHGRSFDLTTDAGRADLFDQYSKAAVGTAAIVLLAAAGAGDDDKAKVRVHGAGPADPARRNQLRQQGWIPWSIQVGDRFVSYAETPVGLALAVVGSYLDATRYRKFEQADLADRLALIATALPRLVVQRSFLRGLSDLFSGLSTETSPRRAADKLTSAAVRTGAGFVVPGIFEQIDRVMDPQLTDTSTVQGALYAAVPFLRRAGNPTLNVLGEPVEISPLARFTSKSTPDPLWSALAQKGAWIAKPATDGLTDEQAYDLVKVRGAILRPFLESRVTLIQRLPPEQAQRFVSQATEAATRQAKAQLGVLRRPAR